MEVTKIHNNSELNDNSVENILQVCNGFVHTLESSCTKSKKTLLQRKAFAKWRTVNNVHDLLKLHSPFEKMYRDTLYCCETMHQEGQYLTGNYCGHRWCLVCSRILTAKLIQGYGPILSQFQSPRFITLTIVCVNEYELLKALKNMIRVFNLINHNFRQRRPYRIIGIRKIEIEPGRHPGEYHPHFHILLEGEQEGWALIEEWLKHFPTADIRGQKNQPCDKGSLAEFFKYATKPAVHSDKVKGKEISSAYQLDVIYQTLHHRRIYQPIGIKKCVPEKIEGILSQRIPDLKPAIQDWKWDHKEEDWKNTNGDKLSLYRQNKEIPGFVPVLGYHKCRN